MNRISGQGATTAVRAFILPIASRHTILYNKIKYFIYVVINIITKYLIINITAFMHALYRVSLINAIICFQVNVKLSTRARLFVCL